GLNHINVQQGPIFSHSAMVLQAAIHGQGIALANNVMAQSEIEVNVPDSPRRHAPCPACGGKDRFRFDDNGRGSFICNQCGAGDGL
ncbi:hypothetical protein MJN51_36035, partial [Salmonella enterica subsp. enterica serovar Kentucky]|nr:hypothetical protein [Salmonella enterica subsp. enterica serovar Kentucky]